MHIWNEFFKVRQFELHIIISIVDEREMANVEDFIQGKQTPCILGQHEPKEWDWNQRNVLHCTSQSTEFMAEIHLKCRKRIRSRSYNFTLKIHVCQFHTSDF